MSSVCQPTTIFHHCDDSDMLFRGIDSVISQFVLYGEFNSTSADVQEFITTDAYKIISIGALGSNVLNIVKLMAYMYEYVDYVYIYTEELFEDYAQFIQKYDFANITFILPGILNFEMNNAEVIASPFWIADTANLYLSNPHLVSDYYQNKSKDYHFDLLFGIPKNHRLYISQNINNDLPVFKSNFLNSNSMHSDVLTTTPDNIWEDDIKDYGDPYYIKYRNVKCRVSQVIPLTIYKQTAFSLVCETHAENICSFFTEKIAKPILAKRMFVVVSGQYYLKNLRALGFKTFDSIIDESYDLEADDTKRYDMILAEVERMCSMDQHYLYNIITEIVEHNYNIIRDIRDNNIPGPGSVLMERFESNGETTTDNSVGVLVDNYLDLGGSLANLKNITVYNDLELFLNSDHSSKVAIIEPTYEPQDYPKLRLVLEKLKRIDNVIVYSIEMNDNINGIIHASDYSNFYFVMSGMLNTPLQNATYIDQQFWLNSTAHNYQYFLPHVLGKLDNKSPKAFSFEVMYGVIKPHRKYVFDAVSNFPKDSVFQTKFLKSSTATETGFFDNPDNIWEADFKVVEQIGALEYYGRIMPPSQVMPLTIYNQSAYSLVCESEYSNNFSFFTEKIAKPVLAKRLFIIISGRHYLKNLRALGFKTFDSIIDESYDLEADDTTRWDMALVEVRKLIALDRDLVLDKCQDIFEHNFNQLNVLRNKDNKMHTLIGTVIKELGGQG